MPILSTECCFVLITSRDPELVVGICHIEAGVVLGILEAVKKLGHKGEGITVLNCNLIELTIIDTKAEGAIWLFDEENGRSEGRLGGTDEPFGNHFINVLFENESSDLDML